MQGATDPIIAAVFKRHYDEIAASWQARLLARALVLDSRGIARPRDAMGAVILSVLAHNFDDAMPVLLCVALPGFQAIGVPFLCSAGRIARTGNVMADLIDKQGRKFKNQNLFNNTDRMQAAFRRLADAERLPDADREALFAAVRNWVVCDFRLDPAMDPADPDSKRLH